MAKKLISICTILILLVVFIGCSTHNHVVGNGSQDGSSVSTKQWYILWGLVPLNDVDTKAMAEGSSDYEIKTQSSFIDIIIGIFTGIVTISPRSVTVTK